MPNMNSLSLAVQNLWPRLKFLLPQSHRQTESQTGQKLEAPGMEFSIKTVGHCQQMCET